MLRLKKISLVGFKTFCDRTELTVPGTGIAVVAGPNGCGKSNILDGMSWVLGEQSAKSLRGAQMQDVIFAGTPDRRPLAMAEVTLTLVDSELYEEALPVAWESVDDASQCVDWDEDEMRRQRAAEAENIAAAPTRNKLALRQGETIITRRLFRAGESEYLINGKPCRLRDLQEIFLSTGLGPDTYAVIGQEQIGQLLSSKPYDRRAVIEAAAGVSELKMQRRVVEKRLNGAKDSLARVDDILDEVSKQVISLRRQAAKAGRLGEVRDDLHRHLRIVMASRIALIDAELGQLESEIASLNAKTEEASARIEATEAQRHAVAQHGYELERAAQEAQSMASAAELELERATAKQRDNAERLRELEERQSEAARELEQTRTELTDALKEREQLEATSTSTNEAFRSLQEKAMARQQGVRRIREALFALEQQVQAHRRQAAQLMTRAGEVRSKTSRTRESLTMLEQEANRLASEVREGQETLTHLDSERSNIRKRFEAATEALAEVEREIATLRERLHTLRTDETVAQTRANDLRAEQAATSGRLRAVDAMLRDHSYATETAQKLLRTGAVLKPATLLADYLEVDEQHEQIVDEFLRDELNYVVVESWSAAEKGVQLLKSTIDGRATFLVPTKPDGHCPRNGNHDLLARPGITPLRDEIRVLNGLGRSLDAAVPKITNGYIVDDPEEARTLAAECPGGFFLTAQGECFHNSTVTGGTPVHEGPLALKRERHLTERRLESIERDLIHAEVDGAALATTIERLSEELKVRSQSRQQIETDLANQGAGLKQLEAAIARADRELQERRSQAKRNDEAREAKRLNILETSEEIEVLEIAYEEADSALELRISELAALREVHDGLEQDVVGDTAELARLTERRRGIEASLQNSTNSCAGLEQRLLAMTERWTTSEAERLQRLTTDFTEQIRSVAVKLTESRAQSETVGAELHSLRQSLALLESELKAERGALDCVREDRDSYLQNLARLHADLEHYAATSFADLGIDVELLRTDESIARLAVDELKSAEESCRQLRARIEQMGPVNMMALDEYNEAAARQEFLQTQRKDLVAAIESAQSEIREIDQVVEARFGEALARINENFAKVFVRLFSGGHAQLRTTQAENQREAGLEITASPPGKRLQNALLLSGGEKALTALALLVAIFQYRPSPFCVLDEVDAPLDETNIGRFADFMRSLSGDTQFLVVTHSRRMMEAADMIFGITMQEPGLSKVLSLRLNCSA